MAGFALSDEATAVVIIVFTLAILLCIALSATALAKSLDKEESQVVVNSSGFGQTNNLAAFKTPTSLVDSGISELFVVQQKNATVTSGNVASYSDTTGLSIVDSGHALSEYVPLIGGNMTGPLDSTAALNLGTGSATSVNIGNAGKLTTINGIASVIQSYVSWYSVVNTNPSFTDLLWTATPQVIGGSELQDFTVSNGAMTYTGAKTRTFIYIANLNVSTTTAGSFFTCMINNAAAIPIPLDNQTQTITDFFTADETDREQIDWGGMLTMATGDTLSLCCKWSNTSAIQVTLGKTNFTMFALLN
jgi:hypothetical protein